MWNYLKCSFVRIYFYVIQKDSNPSQGVLFSRKRFSNYFWEYWEQSSLLSCSLVTPEILTFFWDEVSPETIETAEAGTPIVVLISLITALFAFPSTAGAATRQPIAFRQSL